MIGFIVFSLLLTSAFSQTVEPTPDPHVPCNATSCPAGFVCSKFGWCGAGPDYDSSISWTACNLTGTIECPAGQCCSIFRYCIVSSSLCLGPTTPTAAPTLAPTQIPTSAATEAPTQAATDAPTVPVTEAPTVPVTEAPTAVPTSPATQAPTVAPTDPATSPPATAAPTDPVTAAPTSPATMAPTLSPTNPATSPPPPNNTVIEPQPGVKQGQQTGASEPGAWERYSSAVGGQTEAAVIAVIAGVIVLVAVVLLGFCVRNTCCTRKAQVNGKMNAASPPPPPAGIAVRA